MNDFGNGLLVALGIGMLIFVHELGHYLAARWIGARVEVFSLGFGPRLLGFRRGPTDYRLSLIPLGGYVAVAGQDPDDHQHLLEHSLQDKSVGQRFLFFCGGVVMNLLFALVAFPIAFGNGVSFPAPVIGNVALGGAAWEAGLQRGDRVLAVHGKSMYSFENLVVEIALSGGRPVPMLVDRNGEPRAIEVLPRYSATDGLYGVGIEMAVSEAPTTLVIAPGGPAALAGFETGDELLQIDGKTATIDGPPDDETQLHLQEGRPVELRVRRKAKDGTVSEIAAAVMPLPRTSERALLGVEPLRRLVGGIRPGFHVVDQLGLLRNDVVLAIDGQTFRGQDLKSPLPSGALRLLVQRGDRRLELSAPATDEDRAKFADYVALLPDFEATALKPMPEGAAIDAGIAAGDRLLSIDGAAVSTWIQLQAVVRKAGNRPLRVEIEQLPDLPGSPAKTRTLTLSPRQPIAHDYGYIRQVERLRNEVQASSTLDAMRLGSICALDLIKQLYVTMKRLLTGEVAASNLGGIIQISRVSYQNTQWGLPRFLYFLALLSINLAFVNVLPIPVLDGGHLLFLLIERIKGSPVSVRIFNYSQVLGLVLVLALVVFVTYNDILRLL